MAITTRHFPDAYRLLEGVAYAQETGAQANELLNQGYILIIDLLMSPNDDNTLTAYEDLKNRFKPLEHGDDFIQQPDTAHSVFSS